MFRDISFELSSDNPPSLDLKNVRDVLRHLTKGKFFYTAAA